MEFQHQGAWLTVLGRFQAPDGCAGASRRDAYRAFRQTIAEHPDHERLVRRFEELMDEFRAQRPTSAHVWKDLIGNHRAAFQAEFLGTFEPTPEERQLHDLADEYERRCESYDQVVCDGRTKRGIAIPLNGAQQAMISRHARQVWNELMPQAASLGFDAKQFREAIREAQRRSEPHSQK